MFDFLSAAGAIGGAIGGYNQQKEARRAGSRALERGDQILGLWDPFDPERGGGEFARMRDRGGTFGMRREYMQKLLENAQGAFKGARQDARRGAKTARNTARQTGETMQADASQALQQRGLFGSTIGQQAASGISYRTGQALADIDMQLGSLLGDIGLQESQVMDQVLRGNLAIEEQTADEMMRYVVGNTGHGPGFSSTMFNSGMGHGAETMQAFNPFDVGGGASALMDIFGQTQIGGSLNDILSSFF